MRASLLLRERAVLAGKGESVSKRRKQRNNLSGSLKRRIGEISNGVIMKAKIKKKAYSGTICITMPYNAAFYSLYQRLCIMTHYQ